MLFGVCLTCEQWSVYQSRGLQNDDRQVRIQLSNLILSAQGQEDWWAPCCDHRHPAYFQRGQFSFSLMGNAERQYTVICFVTYAWDETHSSMLTELKICFVIVTFKFFQVLFNELNKLNDFYEL